MLRGNIAPGGSVIKQSAVQPANSKSSIKYLPPGRRLVICGVSFDKTSKESKFKLIPAS